jgi:hypothetical protein
MVRERVGGGLKLHEIQSLMVRSVLAFAFSAVSIVYRTQHDSCPCRAVRRALSYMMAWKDRGDYQVYKSVSSIVRRDGGPIFNSFLLLEASSSTTLE